MGYFEQEIIASIGAIEPTTVVDDRSGNVQEMVDRDEPPDWPGDARVRLWRNDRCIVATRHQARRPSFADARQLSELAGWPVALRRSGGTTVIHRPGILNVSYRIDVNRGESLPVERGYRLLIDLLAASLAKLNMRCDAGSVPASACDGSYNLRWNGRKLAGTAAFISHQPTTTVGVFHASVAVEGSIEDDLIAIRRFEAALHSDRPYEDARHVTVAEAMGSLVHTGIRSAMRS